MKMLSRLVIMVAIAFSLCSCSDDKVYIIENDSLLNFETKFKSVGTFPYSMVDQRQEKIIHVYSNISLGIDVQYVLNNMGLPDIKDKVYPAHDEKLFTISMLYIFSMDGLLSNENHNIKAVALYFNSDEKLIAALPKNIKRLKKIGSIHNDNLRYQLYW